VVTKLNQELVRILTTTDVKDQIAKIGADVIANTPEQTAALIRTDLKRYGDLIRKLGIRVE
jgi:tripartite-type tricarboxylate transporter receptor subunit TctC